MGVKSRLNVKVAFADKKALRKILEEQDARTGFVPDPTATPEKVRAMMLADGICPEDNEFSRELIRMRYEEE